LKLAAPKEGSLSTTMIRSSYRLKPPGICMLTHNVFITVSIQTKFSNAVISSHSFDKGFWSKDNLAILEPEKTETVVLPKRGRQTKEDKEREDQPDFKLLRRKHSAVESNINMPEHHGLNRCSGKGLRHYKNYVGLSVLAHNLHQLCKKIIAKY
jgi:IS5 family transposase